MIDSNELEQVDKEVQRRENKADDDEAAGSDDGTRGALPGARGDGKHLIFWHTMAEDNDDVKQKKQ